MLLYRIARESGTDGLSCMLPLTKLPGYPNMILYRPLLYMTDVSLPSAVVIIILLGDNTRIK